MEFRVKRYKKDYNYSYSLGMAPTIELITYKKDYIYKVFIHPDYKPTDDNLDIRKLCQEHKIPYQINEKIFNRLANKGNIFVIGVFYKYNNELDPKAAHVILVNPSNAGNLGTILRTGLGFGFNNIAIIEPSVDYFNPNSIRSSMGAIFTSNIESFKTIEEYRAKYDHHFYCFILDAKTKLKEIEPPRDRKYALVFGNEATGLDQVYKDFGTSVFINHSDKIDSLNLAISFGIAANYFSDF